MSRSALFVFCGITMLSATVFCQMGAGLGGSASSGKPGVHGESYYFDAFGVSGVYVRDENMGFSGEAGGYFINQAKGVTYDIVNERQASMTLLPRIHT